MKALRYLENRIGLFTALPTAKREERTFAAKLKDIGRTEGASAERREDPQ